MGYYTTGIYSSAVPDEKAATGQGLCNMPLFAQDKHRRRGKEGSCTKFQHASGALSPGVLV